MRTFERFNARLKLNQKVMNGYIAIYKNKRIELYAETIYEAQLKAAEHFRIKDGWKISLHLAQDSKGNQVVHVADF